MQKLKIAKLQKLHNMQNIKITTIATYAKYAKYANMQNQATNKIQRLLLKGRPREKCSKTTFKREPTLKTNQRLLLKGSQLGGGRRRAAAHANPDLECYLTPKEVRTPQCKHCLGNNMQNSKITTIATYAKYAKYVNMQNQATKKIQRLLLKGRPLENCSKTTFKREATRRRAAAGGNIRKSWRECYLTPKEVRTPQCKHCFGE